MTSAHGFSGRGKWMAAAAALALSPMMTAGTAHAHGGVVRAFEVLNNPAKPDTFILRSDVWGFFYSHDAGKSWQWSCSEVYGTKSTEVNHAQMALTAGGRLLVGNGFKGVFYTDTFCSWTKATGLDDLLIADVQARGNEVMALSSTGGGDGISNVLWASDDQGSSFETFNDDFPKDIVLSSFALAPSDPKRVYALGLVVGKAEGVVLRSDDGGTTFERMTAPAIDAARLSLRIHAIHPTNPDVLFEWIDLPESLNEDSMDEIWMTKDGGTTWSQVFAGKGDLPGFAISPDGSTLVISGAVDGVHTGALNAVMDSPESALAQVNPRPVWGLLWNENGLYGGNNNFSVKGTPETYTLGISSNDGASFEEVVNICEFEFSACDEASQVGELCSFNWEDPSELGGFKKDFWLDSGRCGPDGGGAPGSDAGAGGRGTGGASGSSGGTSPSSGGGSATGGSQGSGGSAPADEDGGCAMSAPGSATPSGGLLALALGAVGLGWLRRRR